MPLFQSPDSGHSLKSAPDHVKSAADMLVQNDGWGKAQNNGRRTLAMDTILSVPLRQPSANLTRSHTLGDHRGWIDPEDEGEALKIRVVETSRSSWFERP